MDNPFGFTFRRCSLDDRDIIFSLVKELLFPYIREYVVPDVRIFDKDFVEQWQHMQLMYDGEQLVGCCALVLEQDHAELNKLLLTSDYQHQGIGSWILSQFEKQTKEAGLDELRLEVRKNNPAVDFYRKQGFKIVEEKPFKWVMRELLA